MQFIALLVETLGLHISENTSSLRISDINYTTFSIDSILKVHTKQITGYFPCLNFGPQKRTPGEVHFPTYSKIRNLNQSRIYGAKFHYTGLEGLPFFHLINSGVVEFSRLFSVFGVRAVAIYSTSFLVFIWLLFFTLLGFVSLERSRIIIVLTMLFTVFVFIFWSYYELQELGNNLMSSKRTSRKQHKIFRFDYLHRLPDDFFIKFKKIKKKLNINYLYLEQADSFFRKERKGGWNIMDFFYTKAVEVPKIFSTQCTVTKGCGSFVELKQSLLTERWSQPIKPSSDLVCGTLLKLVQPVTSCSTSFTSKLSETWGLLESQYREELGEGGEVFISKQNLINLDQVKVHPNKSVSAYQYTQMRISTKQKRNDILSLLVALRTQHNLHSPLNLGVITITSLGGLVTTLAGCYGANIKVMKYRRSLWMTAKDNNYASNFKKLSARIGKKQIYRPWGGCGYIEFTSVEKNPFSKKIEQPNSFRKLINPVFWIKQFQNSIYNRVSTTTLWLLLFVSPLMLSFNHPQWKVAAPFILLMYAFITMTKKGSSMWLGEVRGVLLKFITKIKKQFVQTNNIQHLFFYKPEISCIPEPLVANVVLMALLMLLSCGVYGTVYSLQSYSEKDVILQVMSVTWCFFIFLLNSAQRFSNLYTKIFNKEFLAYVRIVSSFFVFLFLSCCMLKFLLFLFNKFNGNLFVPIILLYLASILTYLAFNKDLESRSKIRGYENPLAVQWFFWFLKYLLISSFTFFVFRFKPFFGILIPYIWFSYILATYFIIFFDYVRFFATSESDSVTDKNYYNYFIIVGLMGGLLSLVSLVTGVYYTPLTYLANLLPFILYLNKPELSNRFRFLEGVLMCFISTGCLLIYMGASFSTNPLSLYVGSSKPLGSLYTFIWVWSYMRLGFIISRIKSMELFIYIMAVVCPLVLLIFFDIINSTQSEIVTIVPYIFFFALISQLFTASWLHAKTAPKKKKKEPFNLPSIFPRSSDSLKKLLTLYLSGCYCILFYIISSTPALDISLIVAMVLLVMAKAITGAWFTISITTTLRTGYLPDLSGSLYNFRFLKKIYNIFMFLVLCFLVMVFFTAMYW